MGRNRYKRCVSCGDKPEHGSVSRACRKKHSEGVVAARLAASARRAAEPSEDPGAGPVKPTKSQLDMVTATLEADKPARAEIRLLEDGAMVVERYATGRSELPYAATAFGRRGQFLRHMYDGLSGPTAVYSEDDPPPRDLHELVLWVRGEWPPLRPD